MNFKRSVLFPLLIVAAGALAYANSFQAVFVFDDVATVEKNSRIRHILPQGKNEWLLSRPLTDLTFALNYATGGLNPADYHATNLAIHIIAGLLLFGVVRRTLQSGAMPDRLRREADALAFVSATIWVAHPLTTAAVTYVSQRYECMMGMFYLLALYCVIRAASSPRSGVWLACAVAACGLGMGCKEIIMTAPAIILAYDWIFLSASPREILRKRWLFYAGLLAAVLALAAAPVISEGKDRDGVGMSYYGGGLSLHYLFTQCGVILRYLRVSLWPYPLCFDYDWPLVSSLSEAIPEVAAVSALGALTLLGLRYRPAAGFLGVWFFGILAPSSSVIPRADCAFEYRMYLPLAAVVVGAVAGLREAMSRLCERRVASPSATSAMAAGLAVLAILTFAAMTHFRNRTYFSEERLWLDVVKVRPGNSRAYVNITKLLYENGQYDRTIAFSKDAFSNMPDYGATDRAELDRRSRDPDADNLRRQLVSYSRIHNNVGLALWKSGKPEEAMRHFEEALRLVPDNAAPQINIASLRFSAGKTNEAIQMLNHVLDIEPEDVVARECLARALTLTGDLAGAIEQYDAVLSREPDHLSAQCDLAWILATCSDERRRDGGRAVALAERAARFAGYGSARVLDILAAAYAEAAEFEKAAATEKKAIQLAGAEEKAAFNWRLDLYSRRAPYRESFVAPGETAKPERETGRTGT